jgi:four helix bundle protein
MTGLKDFRDFAAWQRLDDAAASAPRNIAEGFGRVKPQVFAQFVSIAKGSEGTLE